MTNEQFIGKICRVKIRTYCAFGEFSSFLNEDDCVLIVDYDKKWMCVEALCKDGLVRIPFGSGAAAEFLEAIQCE
jgi:hypothetical protein